MSVCRPRAEPCRLSGRQGASRKLSADRPIVESEASWGISYFLLPVIAVNHPYQTKQHQDVPCSSARRQAGSHGSCSFRLLFLPSSLCSCCECTCVAQPRTDDFSGDDYYGGCGAGFSCIDPSAPCVDDDDITIGLVDTCDTIYMSNAFCDEQNNRPECSECGVLADRSASPSVVRLAKAPHQPQ